jgi:hypothetical protein
MSLNTIPPELQSYILSLACIDASGTTACSLSLVSRLFHQIVQPYMFLSVRLSLGGMETAKAIEKMKALFERLQGDAGMDQMARRGVRRLWIDFSNEGTSRSLSKTLQSSDATRDTLLVSTSPAASKHLSAIESQSLLQSLHALLTITSPTLTSLTILMSSVQTLPLSTLLSARLWRIPFPSLHTLAFSGFYAFPSSTNAFPNLEILHLHGNRNPAGLLQLGALDEACPRLEELHISGLSMALTFAKELKEAFGSDPASDSHPSEALFAPESRNPMDQDSDIFAAHLPASLKRLSVTPAQEAAATPGVKRSRIAMQKEKMMMDVLGSIPTAVHSPGLGSRRCTFELRKGLDGGEVREELDRAWEII